MECYNRWTFETFKKLSETKKHDVHPKVVRWAIKEFGRSGAQRWKRLETRLLRQLKERTENSNEYGIVGLTKLCDADKESLYRKHMRSHGLTGIVPTQTLRRLRELFDIEVEKWKAAPPIPQQWLKRKKPFTKQEFEALMRRTIATYGVSDAFRIGWVRGEPVSVAVYFPGKHVLLLHEWLLKNMRPCDVIVLSLHEIMGHVHQENNNLLPVSSSEAEGCAMKCEALADSIVGSPRASIEWTCMRLARACVDICLHSPSGKREAGRDCHITLWNSFDVGNSFRCFALLEDETLRCAALPAQSLGYVIHPKHASFKGCHQLC